MPPATSLLGVAFLDELASGLAPAGSPAVGLGPASFGLAIFAIPSLAGLVEAPLLVRAERAPRRWLLRALIVLALACFLGTIATGWTLTVALAIYAPASGVACAIAQSELVSRAPSAREREMARWTLAGNAGDLASVGLLSLAALGSFGLRGAFAIAGTLALLQALAMLRTPFVMDAIHDHGDALSPAAAAMPVSAASLVAWLGGLTLCGLLDEIVIGFGAMHLEANLGAGVHERGAVLTAMLVGELAGLVALERLALRVAPLRLLAITAAASLALHLAWVCAGSIATSATLAFLSGMALSPLYPLAKAQAYAAAPHRPALVNALGSLLSPVEWALLPILTGLLASRAGLAAALAALALQPAVLLLLALWSLRSGTRGRARETRSRRPPPSGG